ncbi:MAG: hypothetical protein ACOX3A_05830 [bacterium]
MEIVRLVEAKVLLLAEDILKVLEGGTDYLSFESKLKKELDGLGCEILQVVLEGIEQKIRCFLQVKIPHFCRTFSPGTGGEFLC